MSLNARFDSEPNAITSVRLVLALSVIGWHAVLMTGSAPTLADPVRQLLESVGVDAFFCLSGFLILRSWQRRRSVAHYLGARATRLLPALWMCLLATAFVFAPLAGFGSSLSERVRYVVGNAATFVTEPGFNTGTAGTIDNSWNLSLWTLGWEALAYLGVLVFGLLGWQLRRSLLGLMACSATVLLAFTASGIWPQIPGMHWASAGPRLSFMFACGAALWAFRERVPVRDSWLAVSALAVAVSSLLPVYQLVGGLPLAYLVIVGSLRLGSVSALAGWRTDLSYGVYIYGFPVQLIAATTALGSTAWGNVLVSVLPVLALAWLSWHLVEHPALRWFRRRMGAQSPAQHPDRVPAQ